MMRRSSRSRTLRGLLVLCAAALVAACEEAPPKPVSPAEMAEAAQALAPFKQGLMETLKTALTEGGPENAIDACKLKAPDIAQAAGGQELEVGRTSHRLRNPANAPEPWMEPLLQEYVNNPQDETARAVRLEDGRIGYVEPIHVRGLCLTCHGEVVATEVMVRVHELYPQDRATGFREGDFRGMFWVKMRPAAGAVPAGSPATADSVGPA